MAEGTGGLSASAPLSASASLSAPLSAPMSAPLSSAPMSADPRRQWVLSTDSLRGGRVDQAIPPASAWADPAQFGPGPPLFPGPNGPAALRGACREGAGIPPALRCAVWTANVGRAAGAGEERATLGGLQALGAAWDAALERTFGGGSEEDEGGGDIDGGGVIDIDIDIGEGMPQLPGFGLPPGEVRALLLGDAGEEEEEDGSLPLPPPGRRALRRVLGALGHLHASVEYAPLVPDVARLLLTHMPEPHAYAALRDIVGEASVYLPPTELDHLAYCRTFADIVRRAVPRTARIMERCGALGPEGLGPIFRRFFVPLLRPEHVLRIFDVYTAEGAEVLFRYGLALIRTCKASLKAAPRPATADEFWDRLRIAAHDGGTFDFDALLSRAYGRWGGAALAAASAAAPNRAAAIRDVRPRSTWFPRRRTLARMVRHNEGWAEGLLAERRRRAEEGGAGAGAFPQPPPPTRPLGLVRGPPDAGPVLAGPVSVRAALAPWMPPAHRNTGLELIYSTDVHGRSLDALYDRCSRTRHTVCLLEVLGGGGWEGGGKKGEGKGEEKVKVKEAPGGSVVGMYATQAWTRHARPRVYGDGGCFLFRARPDPVAYRWRPTEEEVADEHGDALLAEQFMVSCPTYLSMGGSKDGGCALRLNEDLTRGESAQAAGFHNDPLGGGEGGGAFEVGLVEVYRLVREIDGRCVDGDDDSAWNLGGFRGG